MGEMIILGLIKIIPELFACNSQQNNMKLVTYFSYHFMVISNNWEIMYNITAGYYE